MSRPPRAGLPVNNRDKLKIDFTRAAPLRDIYPQLAEVHVEFQFEDGSERAPSPQSFSYFPAARGFFRYACPCNSCSGEFDLSAHIAELAGKSGRTKRSRNVSVTCTGQRAQEWNARKACPVNAHIRAVQDPLPASSAVIRANSVTMPRCLPSIPPQGPPHRRRPAQWFR